MTPGVLFGQVRASERGSVSQTVDGTVVTIDYARPLVRGRDPLFGAVVHWGEVWTPGANWATTLEVNRPIRLNDQPVPAGKYSMWMITRETGPWTVFLHSKTRLFHTQRPDTTDHVAAFAVNPVRSSDSLEALTWSFPMVRSDGASLQMQRGTTVITLSVAVGPSRPVARADRDLTPYVGTYLVRFEADSGQKAFEDTVALFQQNGVLRGRFTQTWPGMDPEFDFIPEGDAFVTRYYQGGKVYEEDRETMVVFQIVHGKATGFEFQFENEAYARARRIK
jgi:hypothetical protein